MITISYKKAQTEFSLEFSQMAKMQVTCDIDYKDIIIYGDEVAILRIIARLAKYSNKMPLFSYGYSPNLDTFYLVLQNYISENINVELKVA